MKLTTLNTERSEVCSFQARLKSNISDVMKEYSSTSEEDLLLAKNSCLEILKSCANSENSQLQPRERANMILKVDLEPALRSLQMLASVTTYQECYSKCIASGEGMSQATVGKQSKIVVSLVDHDDKHCKETPANEIQYEMSHINGYCEKLTGCAKRRKGGKYEISYTPTTKGHHQLAIRVNGYHIKDSPFQVNVKSMEKPHQLVQILRCSHKPCSVAHTGDLLVTSNHSKSITVLRQTGDIVRDFAAGNFADATIDKDGNVYATDSDKDEILKLSPKGNFLGVVGGVVGSHDGEVLRYNSPTGIAFNPHNKRLYVTNSQNHEILVLNTDLTLYKAFGEEGSGEKQFSCPSSMCCDNSGKVYVADCGNDRVQVFTAEGKFIRVIGKSGNKLGELKHPRGIATNSKEKLVYVSDSMNQRISVFKSKGQFVRCLGMMGSLDSPRGIVYDSNTDILFICDYNNCRIQMY